MVHIIYPAELQLNKANASNTEAAFLDLNLSIHNDIVSTKIYDKRDDFNYAPNFEKVGSILVSACAFVRSSFRPFKTEFKLGF